MLKPGLVRFLLASIVILYHLSGSIYIGTMAVYCFFMLSGYWVTLMYEKKYSKFNQPVSVFYISRILRLFPVYLFLSLLTIIVSAIYLPGFFASLSAHNGAIGWLSYIFLLGYNLLTVKPIVPAWSLDIELQFYIMLPVLFYLSKSKLNRAVLLAVFAMSSILLLVFFPGIVVSETVIPYLTYFFIGVIIFKNEIRFSRRSEIFFNCLLILILAIHYILSGTGFYKSLKADPHYESYFNQLISLFTIPLLCNCVHNKSHKLDRILGEMSYVLYLTHWLVIIPYNYYITGLSKLQRIPCTLIYLLVTYILSYIIFKYFDKPVDSLRRKWLDSRNLLTSKITTS